MRWQIEQADERDKPVKMYGYTIHCFTCKQDTMKSHLSTRHKDHEVDWVKDGKRVNG